LLNNINNKEDSSKPEKGNGNKMIYAEACTVHTAQAKKTIGK